MKLSKHQHGARDEESLEMECMYICLFYILVLVHVGALRLILVYHDIVLLEACHAWSEVGSLCMA